MDFIRVELEEKYFADVEPWEECIAFSVYIKSGDFSGRGTFVYTVNEFRQLISQLKLIYITLDGDVSIAYDDSDDYVHIICKSYGQIKVEAQLEAVGVIIGLNFFLILIRPY